MSSNVKTIPSVVAATPYVSSGNSDTSLYASPLLDAYDGRNVQTAQAHSMYSSYDDRYRVSKARRNIFGGICCCCCTLFLLLFFLIPRSPVLSYQSAQLTAKPYQLIQSYKVTNNNPYGIVLSNVNTIVSSYISAAGETIYAYGTLQGADSIDIGSASNVNVNVVYNFTETATATLIGQSVAQCFTSQIGALYTTQGTFDFSTTVALHDWHNVNLGTFGVLYKCN